MANYSNGSKGDEVKQIQQALANSGYKIAVDGIYGNQTASAVKQYQQSKGLGVDGIVGQQTWGSLFSGGGGQTQQAAAPQTASNGSTGWEAYLQQARGMYDPGYNQNVQTVTDQNTALINGLNAQKGDVNKAYDNQIVDIGRSTSNTQNQFSGNMVGRGMGRSTLVTTGLAGIAESGQRSTDKANEGRNSDIQNIDNQANQANTSLASKLAAMKSDYETGVMGLAQQLKQYDEEMAFKQKQFDADQAFRQQQLALQKASASASRSSASSSAANKAYDKYLDIGLDMRKAKNSDAQLLSWVKGLDLSASEKAKLSNTLNIDVNYAYDYNRDVLNQYIPNAYY